MIVAFTGHRPQKIGGYDMQNPTALAVWRKVHDLLKELKPEKTISGMALGVDQLCACASIDLGIPVIAAIPCDGQESIWPQNSQDHYHWILAQTDEQVVVSPGPYSVDKMMKRNAYMVDRCDTLIAVFDGTKGGTSNCVRYAEKKGKRIIVIDPSKFNPISKRWLDA